MKNLLSIIALLALVSCGSGGNEESGEPVSQQEFNALMALPDCQKNMKEDFKKATELVYAVHDIFEGNYDEFSEQIVENYLDVSEYIQQKYEASAKCKDHVEVKYVAGQLKRIVHYTDFTEDYNYIVELGKTLKEMM